MVSMYYGGHSNASWFVFVIPVAIALLVRMRAGSGRQRGEGRPPPGGSFFTGPPAGGPGSIPDTAPPHPASPPGHPAEGSGTPAGWFTDPFVRHEQRYWSGSEWTEHVLDRGTPSNDPPPAPGPDAGQGPGAGTDGP